MRTMGRLSSLHLLAGFAAVVVVLGAGMYLYDHSRREQIADGVRIGGVNVGGLSAQQARVKLRSRLGIALARPVVVRSGASAWKLTGSEAGLRVNIGEMVGQAVTISRRGSIFSRTARGLFGGSVHQDIPLQVSYSHGAVRALTARVRGAIDRPPRDATVQAGAGGLQEIPGEVGRMVDGSLGARVEQALTALTGSRTVTVPTHHVQPAVTISQLAERYPAYIVVDRGAFQLRFYQHLRLADTYPIAVGMQGLETPPGLYHIQWKQVNPPWYVPKSAWAGSLAGKTIPPGPEDPLKARFMSFDGGAGIHGIDPSEYSTIGHDASHGCVRMRIPDVIALYSRTPVGTPVYIA